MVRSCSAAASRSRASNPSGARNRIVSGYGITIPNMDGRTADAEASLAILLGGGGDRPPSGHPAIPRSGGRARLQHRRRGRYSFACRPRSGNRDLAAATGAQLYLYDEADTLFPFQPLRDGDEISLGQVVLRVVHTPGHRPEGLSLLVVNPARSPEPSMVLTGDSLFVGDVGRPDFGGPEGASQQYQSIQKLLQLEDYVEVFPAHFEGSCGKGMCPNPHRWT